jgi:hypothetical protein
VAGGRPARRVEVEALVTAAAARVARSQGTLARLEGAIVAVGGEPGFSGLRYTLEATDPARGALARALRPRHRPRPER